MGSTAREIEQHIASERGKLDRDIHELQTRVQNATDWRWQVQRRPLTAVAFALTGGLLAAVFTGRRERRNWHYRETYVQPMPRKTRDVIFGFAMGLGMRGLAKYLQS